MTRNSEKGVFEENGIVSWNVNSFWILAGAVSADEMISCGADTFWEAFKQGDSRFSPYDDCVLNSACHAWSCTPIYLIKKYLET